MLSPTLQDLAHLISALLYSERFFFTSSFGKGMLHLQIILIILYLIFSLEGGGGDYCSLYPEDEAPQDKARSLLTWAPLFRHNN